MPPRLQSQPNFEDGSVYRQLRPTKLDKIENFHSLDSIATETYGTHGRLTCRED